MMYTNIWYVAETSENLGDKPLLVRMLGRDFVLFRDIGSTRVSEQCVPSSWRKPREGQVRGRHDHLSVSRLGIQ